ncbi:DUF4003 family protein [Ureibacillus acetophenoni]|uniref:Uncharacterized protein DUF4003 n=1 Tax=Ureibacillus acetophenoni TaxID=614649 RepID=A0A285UCU6_9BACL|nr:DUF4003 family protein [Ureibacillus acetophenoni]SOC39218.1 uncharacterized protein DUF4003 [Ureibacillus acetophenoni]
MNNNEFIELFEKNYEKVKSHLGWSVDKRVAVMIASSYSSKGKSFNEQTFNEVIQAIKQQTKWYHTLRVSGNLQYCIAMMLDGKGDTNSLVNELLVNEELLKSVKFTRTQYSYIAALFLPNDEANKKTIAENAQKLYKTIRKHHPFLTSYEDVPFAVLLSSEVDDSEKRAAIMNRYYKELRENNFYMGNELQWLSQILTFYGTEYVEQLVPYVIEIRKQLNDNGIKIKHIHYPILGFLAIAGTNTAQINEISNLFKELSKLKLLRWYKDIILSIAVQKYLCDLVNVNESLEMSIVTSFEMLLQAEQAMMISVTMAAVVASSSSSSS